jgi:hypothetical protein
MPPPMSTKVPSMATDLYASLTHRGLFFGGEDGCGAASEEACRTHCLVVIALCGDKEVASCGRLTKVRVLPLLKDARRCGETLRHAFGVREEIFVTRDIDRGFRRSIATVWGRRVRRSTRGCRCWSIREVRVTQSCRNHIGPM